MKIVTVLYQCHIRFLFIYIFYWQTIHDNKITRCFFKTYQCSALTKSHFWTFPSSHKENCSLPLLLLLYFCLHVLLTTKFIKKTERSVSGIFTHRVPYGPEFCHTPFIYCNFIVKLHSGALKRQNAAVALRGEGKETTGSVGRWLWRYFVRRTK